MTDTFNSRFAIQNENNISQDAPKMRNPKGWKYTHDIIITRSVHVTITVQSGPGQRSWYSDSLRVRQSWNRIPVRVNFLHLFKTVLGPTRPPAKWVPRFLSSEFSDRVVALTTHSHLAPKIKREQSDVSSSFYAFKTCPRVNYNFTNLQTSHKKWISVWILLFFLYKTNS